MSVRRPVIFKFHPALLVLLWPICLWPAVTSPLKWDLENATEYQNDYLVQNGFLPVTHFGADPTGQLDSTEGIQNCINAAYANNMACYFPLGEYLISAQLNCIQEAKDMTNTHILIGEYKDGNRPIVKLADNTLSGEPTAVIFMQARNPDGTENVPSGYNMLFRGIDLDLGSGNSGAVGIYLHGAQGSAIQDVRINGSGYYAGIQHLSGSGACYGNIEITGGDYGLDTTGDIGKDPIIVGLKLYDQEKEPLHLDTATPVTIVGFHFRVKTGSLTRIEKRYNNCSTHLGLIDGIIEMDDPSAPAIVNVDRSIFLKQVYFYNCDVLVDNYQGSDLVGTRGGWTEVREFSFFHEDETRLVDNALGGQEIVVDFSQRNFTGNIPQDLINRHAWDERAIANPGEQHRFLNAGSFGIDRRGIEDSTIALQNAIDEASGQDKLLFIPKGEYKISDTLTLYDNSRLSGISRNLSLLLADPEWSATDDTPMVETVSATEATTQIAFLKLQPPADYTNKIFYLDWKAGRRSTVREVWFEKLWSSKPYAAKTIRITGTGGGRWYGLFTRQGGPASRIQGFRYLVVEHTTEPLHLYAYCPEYAESDYQVEFNSSRNIYVYALKSESDLDFDYNAPPLLVRNCNNVMICGYTGIGQVDSQDGLIEVTGSNNILIANMARWGKYFSSPANTWYYVYDMDSGNGIISGFTAEPPGKDINVTSIFKKGSVTMRYGLDCQDDSTTSYWSSEWFGYCAPTCSKNWTYSQDLHWIWPLGNNHLDQWMWSGDDGWIWTSLLCYPNTYNVKLTQWTGLSEG